MAIDPLSVPFEARPEPLTRAAPSPARRLMSATPRGAVAIADVTAVAGSAALVPAGVAGTLHAALLAALLLRWGPRARLSTRALDEVPWVAARSGTALLAPAVLALFSVIPAAVLVQALVAVPLVAAGRAGAYAVLRALRRRGRLVATTAVVGDSPAALELAGLLVDHPELGMVPVGPLARSEGGVVPLVRDAAALTDAITWIGVDRILVADGEQDPAVAEILARACDLGVEAWICPRYASLGLAGPERGGDDVRGVPLVPVPVPAWRRPSWKAKRGAERLVAAVALVATAPVLAAVAVLVKLTGGGPVLFRQRRVGERGREFELLKFRTMHCDVDGDHQWQVGPAGHTPVGTLLRRTSLDELPQLWNVVRGDMSVVGPRPERPVFVERFEREVDGYAGRHRVPGGITGWAAVHGLRGDTSIAERARFDNWYVEHWSPWRDVETLLRTGPAAFKGS